MKIIRVPVLLTLALGLSLARISHSNAMQDPASISLRDQARVQGGRVDSFVSVTSATVSLPDLVAGSNAIIEGDIVGVTTALNKQETAVLTLYSVAVRRFLKNDTSSTPKQRPAFAAPVTFSFPGGVVDSDGLHIAQTYSNAIRPSLEKGDAIIAFLVAQSDSDEFRLFHGPFGLFLVRGDELHAANDEVAKYRPEKFTSAAGIRSAIERLLRRPSR